MVVFKVAGTIDGDVKIKKDHITIAGQSAPGEGLTIKGNLAIDANDVVVRYLRVRTDHGGEALGGRDRYPEGRWCGDSAWGRIRVKQEIPNDAELTAYLEPQWRWIDAIQNDFAARADWCVKEFRDANHAPLIQRKGLLNRNVRAGETAKLAASATDPDGNKLACRWWQYADADSAVATVTIANADSLDEASFVVPNEPGKQVHIILEVTDNGTPPLTRYQRVICNIK
jgi:hypothetical protein